MHNLEFAVEWCACKVKQRECRGTGRSGDALLLTFRCDRDIRACLHTDFLPLLCSSLKNQLDAASQADISRLQEVVSVDQQINVTSHAWTKEGSIDSAFVAAGRMRYAGPLRAVWSRLAHASNIAEPGPGQNRCSDTEANRLLRSLAALIHNRDTADASSAERARLAAIVDEQTRATVIGRSERR
jgi:hypothetical protein